MQKYFDNVISSNGTPLSGASIQVNVSGGSAATIYSDNGITVRSNPVLTDSLGYFEFYVANGNYNLIVSKAGYPSVTRSDVTIGGGGVPSGEDSASNIVYDPVTGRVTQVTNVTTGEVIDFTYNLAGQPSSIISTLNGVVKTKTFTYNAAGQLTNVPLWV